MPFIFSDKIFIIVFEGFFASVQTAKQITLNYIVLAALVVILELHETGVKIKWKINLWSTIKRNITCSY
jgi:hypothetical protein